MIFVLVAASALCLAGALFSMWYAVRIRKSVVEFNTRFLEFIKTEAPAREKLDTLTAQNQAVLDKCDIFQEAACNAAVLTSALVTDHSKRIEAIEEMLARRASEN